MADEFIIKIVDEGSSGSVNNTPPASKGGGAGNLFGGLFKIGGAVGVILQIMQSFKPLISMINNVIRILVEFLRPIADVVMLLLYPILQILKPILQVFREIMAPFRKLAFSLASQAGQARAAGDTETALKLQGLSISTLLQGLNVAVFGIFGEVLKTIIDVLSFNIQSLVGFLGGAFSTLAPFASEQILLLTDSAQKSIQDGVKISKDIIDAGVSFMIIGTAKTIEAQIKAIGLSDKVDLTQFKLDIKNLIQNVILKDDNSFKSNIVNAMNNLISPFNDSADAFSSNAETKIKDIFDRMNKALGTIERKSADISDAQRKRDAFLGNVRTTSLGVSGVDVSVPSFNLR